MLSHAGTFPSSRIVQPFARDQIVQNIRYDLGSLILRHHVTLLKINISGRFLSPEISEKASATEHLEIFSQKRYTHPRSNIHSGLTDSTSCARDRPAQTLIPRTRSQTPSRLINNASVFFVALHFSRLRVTYTRSRARVRFAVHLRAESFLTQRRTKLSISSSRGERGRNANASCALDNKSRRKYAGIFPSRTTHVYYLLFRQRLKTLSDCRELKTRFLVPHSVGMPTARGW